MTADHSQLALYGGRPVREGLLPYGRHTILEADIQAVVEVLRSEWVTTGPKVEEFEEALAESVGAAHVVCFSSGTAALHAAAAAAGLGAGGEAITTPLTFCATANCVLYQGATPVFADICADTLTLDPTHVAARITPRTKAILPVDYAGHPFDLEVFLALAAQHNLVIIEDAAHALGATFRGRPVGSISHLTVFSFHPVKHVTTGEGGAVATNDGVYADKLQRFRNHGINTGTRERHAAGTWRYDMTSLGFNYRLSDIGCALGIAQLSRLAANVQCRRAIASRYADELADVPLLKLPAEGQNLESAWHLYPVRVLPPLVRDDVWSALRAEGLGVSVHYPPVHLHSYYRRRFGFSEGAYPEAERAGEQLISLPIFHGMTPSDVDDVVRAVRKVLTHFAREVPA